MPVLKKGFKPMLSQIYTLSLNCTSRTSPIWIESPHGRVAPTSCWIPEAQKVIVFHINKQEIINFWGWLAVSSLEGMSWLFGHWGLYKWYILFWEVSIHGWRLDEEFLDEILKALGTYQIMMRTFWAFFFLTLKTMALSRRTNTLESPMSYQ